MSTDRLDLGDRVRIIGPNIGGRRSRYLVGCFAEVTSYSPIDLSSPRWYNVALLDDHGQKQEEGEYCSPDETEGSVTLTFPLESLEFIGH